MTTRVAIARRAPRLKTRLKKTQRKDAWAMIRGLWKGRAEDAVAYQRAVRREADASHV